MPDRADKDFFVLAPILPHELSDDTSSPTLSEMSPRDKPWDKHRANADIVAEHYKSDKSKDFSKYGDRVSLCSRLLDFRLVPDSEQGSYNLKLSSARFCRVRHCPVCQWRRSLMWKARAYQILPKIVSDYPKHRWIFLTLTLKNCPITGLKDVIGLMNKGWQRLSQLKKFPAVGWLKSLEVTKGRDGSAHPHFHCLLLVPSNYFSGKAYLKQSQWVEMWRKSLRVDYDPILDVQAIKQADKPMQLVPELLKYCVKESDLVGDQEWFLELTRQMNKMRCVATGGVLKDYLKALEEELEDLIGKGEDEKDEVDEGHLYFGWNEKYRKYKLID